jgi:hypothetical protein
MVSLFYTASLTFKEAYSEDLNEPSSSLAASSAILILFKSSLTNSELMAAIHPQTINIEIQ